MNEQLIIAKNLGFNSLEDFQSHFFSRNIGFLAKSEMVELRHKTVAIPGLGGVGGIHLVTLLRTGFCNFHVADLDIFEPANANRQYGAKMSNLHKPKLDCMLNEAYEINPYANFKTFPDGVSETNIDEFLDGVDIVIDGLDVLVIDLRIKLFKKAYDLGIPVVTAGPLGFGTSAIVFSPKAGMSFEDYTAITESMTLEEKFIHFVISVGPKILHSKYMLPLAVQPARQQFPSLGIGCQLAASTAVTLALKILLDRKGVKYAPNFLAIDPYLGITRKGKLWFGNKNIFQRMKIFLIKNQIKKSCLEKAIEPEVPVLDLHQKSISQDVLKYIIKAGIQAPSGENLQPWTFKIIDNDTINIYINRNADQSFFNLDNKASLISIGAVVENMKIAATLFNFESSIKFYSIRNESLVASIFFKKSNLKKDYLSQYIWERCVNRKPYEKKPLKNYIFDEILAELIDFPDVQLFKLEGNDLNKLRKITEIFAEIRTEIKSVHETLHNNIHYSYQDACKAKSGFPLNNLELRLVDKLMVKLTKNWSVQNQLNKFGLSRIIAKKTEEGFSKASACFLITTSDFSDESYFNGGRALERVWLKLTDLGIQIQPMTTINFFHYRYAKEGLINFDKKHHEKFELGMKQFATLFPEIDMQKNGQIMLMRVGYAPLIKTWTPRYEVDDLLEL